VTTPLSCTLALMLGIALASAAAALAADDFYSLMNDAMDRMHVTMHVTPTGDADRDFARMMIPHHQGAIDMAIVELRFGKDERLRRLAQAIIIEQGKEIALMQSILGDAPGPGVSSDAIPHGHPMK
jgi:uncharacterized protein (DUF305 family)